MIQRNKLHNYGLAYWHNGLCAFFGQWAQ